MVGPIILILLGVIFLFSNLGVLDWNLLALLARWWPLILVAVGLELLLGNRRRSAAGAAVLVVGAMIIAGASLFAASPQTREDSHSIVQPLQEASRAEVQLRVGVAGLHVAALDDETLLMSGTVQTRSEERLEQDFRLQGGTAIYRLEARGPSVSTSVFGRQAELRWDLLLNRNVPLELRINTGVGEVDLGLSNLILERLTLEAGVGRTVVRLPAAMQSTAEISTGVGETIVRIPTGAVARVQVSRGLGGVTVRGNLERVGDHYETSGYATATERLDVRLRTGVGSVTVEAGF